jgi:hypothetical protein
MIINPETPAANNFNRVTINQGPNKGQDTSCENRPNGGEAPGATLSISARNRTAAENVKASESAVIDQEKAKQVMAYTRDNILAKSTDALEAQANQLPQSVLTLLK